MIEQIEPGVYRVAKADLRAHLTDVFDALVELYPGGFAYRIVMSRNDSRLNGHSAYVRQADNDFRRYALILLTENQEI